MPFTAASSALASVLSDAQPTEPSALEHPALLVVGGIIVVGLFAGIVIRTLRRNRLRK